VTKKHFFFVCVASFFLPALLAGFASAQPRSGDVALIDIAFVFKNHPRFKQMMVELQNEIQAADSNMKKQQDELRKDVELQKGFQSGSEQYQRYEEEIARKKSGLAVTMDLERKRFLKEEAKIYDMIYKEIVQLVDQIATARGFAVVLRISNDQPDPEKPDTVVANLNRQVVWAARPLDITPLVMAEIQRRMGTADGRNDGQQPRAALPIRE